MEKESNIELLRIILFFMVVTIHVTIPYLSTNIDFFKFNWHISSFLDGISRISVNCFVMITGYYCLDAKENTLRKKILGLMKPFIAYTFMYYLIYVFSSAEFNFKIGIAILIQMFLNILKLETYFYHLWYLLIFIVLTILSPYLNMLIKSFNTTKGFQKFILILGIIVSVLPTFQYIVNYNFINFSAINSKLSLFIYLYILGAFMKQKQITISLKKGILCLIVLLFIIVGGNTLYNSPLSPILYLSKLRGLTPSYPFGGFVGTFYAYDNTFVIMGSAILFIIFLNIKFICSPINKISKLTYGAYIIHVFWIHVLSKFGNISPFIRYDSSKYIIFVMVFILMAAILSLATEFIRLKIESNIVKMIKYNRRLFYRVSNKK